MKRYQVICIDDDRDSLRSLKRSLPETVTPPCPDFACIFHFVASSEELRKVLARADEDGLCPAMPITDQLMPEINGLDLIEQIKDDYPMVIKGESIPVASLRNRGGIAQGCAVADELADKIQGAIIDTGRFDVRERIDLRDVLDEKDLDTAVIVKNENVRKKPSGVKYIVIGGVTVTSGK